MIGVIANASEYPAVREFFELFKTPWSLYRDGEHYDALLCTGDTNVPKTDAKLVVLYAGREVNFDVDEGFETAPAPKEGAYPTYAGTPIPIYGERVAFRRPGASQSNDGYSPILCLYWRNGSMLARVGYDLFAEIHFLLTAGQPATKAAVPSLEMHIALLRELICSAGIPVLEIPPVPKGFQFIACLTHDVDHASIRRHKLDYTMFGFLYRAVVGSAVQLLRGRTCFNDLLTNWMAVLKLPFVYLGLADDFWLQFTRYIRLEAGLRSSFFVIPFKDCPGRTLQGNAPHSRASRYSAAEISGQIHGLICAGCEVGLHGIDAWQDSSSGLNELEAIRQITGAEKIGVRMHWLFFNEQSAALLESAGADYDSTMGYNEAIGYRAGTTQVYKLVGASRLLELPLHFMDTAIFFPGRMKLSRHQAQGQLSHIVDNAVRFGGVVTVNWHDRSIAPERLWGDFYLEVIDELRSRGAWFATAAQTVEWFRKRRSIVLENAETRVFDAITANTDDALPGLQLRICPVNATSPIADPGTRCLLQNEH